MLINKSKIPVFDIITLGFLPSFLKKMIYRLKGYKIGKNVSLGFGSVVIGDNVTIGNHVSIGFFTVIRGNSISIERYAKIGSITFIDTAAIRIGEDARINEQVIIGGMQTPESKLDLGERTIIMEYSYINTTMPIKIGDDSGIGGHCLLFTHGSWLNQLEGFPVSFEPITLGERVWLPWRVFIMPGVELGDEVVVGANSLINKSIESNSLIAGSPAKVIKDNFPSRISKQDKKEYFTNYIDDFIDYLRFNDIKVEKNEKEHSLIVEGIVNNEKFTLLVFYNNFKKIPEIESNTVVIMNITESFYTIPENEKDGLMYLDVDAKKRFGSTDVGEEFVRFVSRFGLRFKRVD